MAEQYANNATTTLSSGINNSTTSVAVTSGSVFPSTGDFRVACGTEIMLCTSRSGNTLTVTRGAESSTAVSHSSGDTISLVLTTASLKALIADNNTTGSGSLPSPTQDGKLYFPTDGISILRDTGSALHPFGPVHRLYNPNAQTWSWGRDYLSAGALLVGPDYQSLIRASVASSGVGYDARKKSAPTAPYKITALVSPTGRAAFEQPAIGFRNSSDDKVKLIRYYANVAGQSVVYATNASGWVESGSSDVASVNVPYSSRIWLQIEDDNTNHYFRYSFDGLNFIEVTNNSRTSHMSAPNEVWWGNQLFGDGATIGTSLLSWREQ